MHEWLRRLRRLLSSSSSTLSDQSPELLELCSLLERVLAHKMNNRSSKSFFQVVLKLNQQQPRESGVNALLAPVLSSLASSSRLVDDIGRSRQLIRVLLNNAWLGSLVITLRGWKLIEQYYSPDSLLRCEPNLGVMSILPQLERVDFDLDLSNSSFLNESWERGELRHVEVRPPLLDLGLMISCVDDGHIVVTRVKQESEAARQADIGLGDILERLDNHDLLGQHPDAVAAIVRRCVDQGRVVKVTLITSQAPIFYAPMVRVWHSIGLDLGDIALRAREGDHHHHFDPLAPDTHDDQSDDDHMEHFRLIYLGSLAVGAVGDASKLDEAIERVSRESDTKHPVKLVLHELGLKVFEQHNNHLVLHVTFPEISACGCSSRDQRLLAFLAGNNLCTMATDFLCHVFLSNKQTEAKEVIRNIAEGFERTRNAV